MFFCWTKGKMTVLGQKSGGSSRTIIFIGLKMSRIVLEAVLDCIFGAMSGCGIVAGAGHVCALKFRKGSCVPVEILKFVGLS